MHAAQSFSLRQSAQSLRAATVKPRSHLRGVRLDRLAIAPASVPCELALAGRLVDERFGETSVMSNYDGN
jgi:hypothetical protein